ncbi:MAG: hypothetical protein JNM41_09640 [Flavipsychrobacter sp.]|nr:hypothetical protein [Flavipsychrobacter sp.]
MGRQEWTEEKLFFRLLNNKSDSTYWDNIRVLRRRPTTHVFEKCILLTHSKDKKARKVGIDVLAQLGETPRPFYTATNKRFFELLNTEKDPEVLMALLYAIGHNNDSLTRPQIDKLCEFEYSDNALIREGLVNALLGVDNTRAIDTLIKLSTDKLNHIRDWATFGLGSQVERDNWKIREALWNRVSDKHKDTKAEAIVGLALRKDDRVKEIILRELLSGDHGTLLFEAIIAVEGKEFLPILKRQLRNEVAGKEGDRDWIDRLKNCIAELTKL